MRIKRSEASHASHDACFLKHKRKEAPAAMKRFLSSSSEDAHKPVIPHKEPAGGTGTLQAAESKRKAPFKQFLKVLGPGIITGASDDDPSGIGTYSTAGASLGYSLLWTALLTFPLMTVVQYLCAKVGMVTGQGLAGVLKRSYSPWILYPVVFALFLANTINAGADLGAIASAINLLVPLPVILLIVPVALLLLALQIWGSYRLIANIFRWLTLALFAYVACGFFIHPDRLAVLQGTFLPILHWNASFIASLVAILGTTISPYLFFWQSDEEVAEKISKGRVTLRQRKGTTDKELRFASWDVIIGMFISNLVMYAIILTTAATLFTTGKHDVQSATDAAQALRPLAGSFASLLLAFGLIGSGCLAVPVLTGSAAYALSEAFGWSYGLEKKLGRAKQFYAIICVATLIGMVISMLGINPITALFWSAVINGILAPPLLLLLMLVTTNRRIMKKRVNNWWLNLIGWLTVVIMTAAAVAFFFTLGKS
jgi:NRAMP (natural resistance-associated macrophage protein)-like metal ion transporter